ncbi:hypothetical protein [Gorillibacterium timonense]|nr:hypothetical protein [Gorillibacterium timonense]
MNLEQVNNTVSRLPIATAGIVHAEYGYGRGLSILPYTYHPFEKNLLP